MNDARHSSSTPEHYTPSIYVEAARVVLGVIDLDPASNPTAQKTVQANRFYSVEECGLSHPWGGGVFCNAPSGEHGKMVKRFWLRVVEHGLQPDPRAMAIWAGFNAGQEQTLQSVHERNPCTFARVTLKKRIRWVPGGKREIQLGFSALEVPDSDVTKENKSPTQHNFFCLIGGDFEARRRFYREFGKFGQPELGFEDMSDAQLELIGAI